MEFLGSRIKLNPRPAQQNAAALEVAMLGHCPGEVRLERLLALTDALIEMRTLGFGARVDQLSSDNADLYHLPIPLRSLAEFEDIFPEARTAATTYNSVLAGDKAWLPQTVEDFFANGGEKCWVVQVPETERVLGFLPTFDSPLYDTENLRGIASALILNDVGLIALPDLERIQIPAQLEDIPRQRLPNPNPQFIPCGESNDDDHRERRNPEEMIAVEETQSFVAVLQKLLAFISKHRPDIQCLFSLPLSYSNQLDSPVVDPQALADIETVRAQNNSYLLRQVQLLFPYIRSPRYDLRSAVGLVAGAIASSARRRGIWRSVAGQALESDARPYPTLQMTEVIALRQSPGIGILQRRTGVLALDDERLTVPALHRNDYVVAPNSERLNGLRSAEVVRFIGFLLRQLKKLGERIIFNVDYQDPRPQLILEKFFNNLFRQGALRGSLPEEAFTIRRASTQEAVIAFDIEVAPAFPIDKIVLTFINKNGIWFPGLNTSKPGTASSSAGGASNA